MFDQCVVLKQDNGMLFWIEHCSLGCFVEEFSKMRDEVPPALTDAHTKMVEDATKEGKSVDAEFGLEKSGIAGTAPEKEEGIKKGLKSKLLRWPITLTLFQSILSLIGLLIICHFPS